MGSSSKKQADEISEGYQLRLVSMVYGPVGAGLCAPDVFLISVEDEGSGEFVSIQETSRESSGIRVNPEEWPGLQRAITKMIDECETTAPDG